MLFVPLVVETLWGAWEEQGESKSRGLELVLPDRIRQRRQDSPPPTLAKTLIVSITL
jgi:hypothetical protein